MGLVGQDVVRRVDLQPAREAFGEGGRALFLTANDRVLRVSLRPGWQG